MTSLRCELNHLLHFSDLMKINEKKKMAKGVFCTIYRVKRPWVDLREKIPMLCGDRKFRNQSQFWQIYRSFLGKHSMWVQFPPDMHWIHCSDCRLLANGSSHQTRPFLVFTRNWRWNFFFTLFLLFCLCAKMVLLIPWFLGLGFIPRERGAFYSKKCNHV